MCVLCVQRIAGNRRELQDPSTGDGRRTKLERSVQRNERYIQRFKDEIVSIESEIEEKEMAISSSLEKQGEPSVAVSIVAMWMVFP